MCESVYFTSVFTVNKARRMLTLAFVISAVSTSSSAILKSHFRSSRVSESTRLDNMFRFAKAAVNLTGKETSFSCAVCCLYVLSRSTFNLSRLTLTQTFHLPVFLWPVTAVSLLTLLAKLTSATPAKVVLKPCCLCS